MNLAEIYYSIGLPETLEPASLEKILAVAAVAEPKMRKIVHRMVGETAV